MSDLKQIIDNAPEGATHYGKGFYYTYKETITTEFIKYEWYEWQNNKSLFVKTTLVGFHDIQSLSDIKKIVELKAQVNALRGMLKEVSKLQDMDMGSAVDWITNNTYDILKLLNKTPGQCLADVKADAIEEAIESIDFMEGSWCGTTHAEICGDLIDHAKQLREQAND